MVCALVTHLMLDVGIVLRSSIPRTFIVNVSAAHGGSDCIEEDGTVERKECAPTVCPQDCVGSWTLWGACSASCDGGNKTRTFSVTRNESEGMTTTCNCARRCFVVMVVWCSCHIYEGGALCLWTDGQTESSACAETDCTTTSTTSTTTTVVR